MSLCTAICISGGYEDDDDRSTEIEYTGQGGNDLLGKRGQYKDQEMKFGNLAMKVGQRAILFPTSCKLNLSLILFFLTLACTLICSLNRTALSWVIQCES